MKILMAVSNFYPALDLGGLVQTPWELAQILSKMGHSIDVVTSNLIGSNRKLSETTVSRQEKNINIFYLNSICNYRASGIVPEIFNFCKSLSDYDVIHIFGLRDFITMVVALKAQDYKVPYIVEPMGMYRHVLRSFLKKWLYDSIIGWKVLAGASKIIATSEFEENQIVLNRTLSHKVLRRINGINVNFFERNITFGSFRSLLGIGDESTLILFLGRVIAIKNIEWLVNILPKMPTTHLAIVGDYSEEPDYYQKLVKNISELSLNERVHFTGPLYGEDKLPAFVDADLFCLPSQSENYGNAVAEAIASNTPVAITDRCGIAPLIQNAGIVIPYDYEAFKNGVVDLVKNPERLQNLKQNCINVKQNLSWELPSQEMIKIYQGLLNKSNQYGGVENR